MATPGFADTPAAHYTDTTKYAWRESSVPTRGGPAGC